MANVLQFFFSSLSNVVEFFINIQLLKIVLKWLFHDWDQRKVHTFNLLKKIRLGLVPVDRLKQVLGDEVFQILAIPECKEILEEVVKLHATKETAKVPLNQSHPDLFATRNTITVSDQFEISNKLQRRTSTGNGTLCKPQTSKGELRLSYNSLQINNLKSPQYQVSVDSNHNHQICGTYSRL